MKIKNVVLLVWLCAIGAAAAQIETNKEGSEYKFEPVKTYAASTVKNQGRTGTCWSFSTLSFLESEMLRNGKSIDLSEMWIVRCAYIEKAINYVRMQGKTNFDEGAEFHDIPSIARKYGLVPEAVYTGLKNGENTYNHSEMVAILKGALSALLGQDKLGDNWQNALTAVVDSYLGAAPSSFTYNGKSYTPASFYDYTGLKLDEYVFVTSFTHHPMYSSFALEIPDNWSMQTAYNVSLDELTDLAKNTLKNKQSFAWASDVSEEGFSFKNGLGIVPMHDSMVQQWGKDNKMFNNGGANREGIAFEKPMPEKEIDATMRQAAFDNQSTTDDHGMHAVGLYTDQNGKYYFKIKNSWGTSNYTGGYLFVSENYFKYKTICIMVHKDALSKDLKTKLNIR